MSDFKEIEFEGLGEIFITQGGEAALLIEADDNLLEYIQTEVKGSKLQISFERNKNLVPSSSITFHIRVIDLESIESAGAGVIKSSGLSGDYLSISSSGAAKILIQGINAQELSIVSAGAGDIELSGNVEMQNIEMSGVGTYSAPNLKSREAVIKISGIGNAVLWVESTLEVEIDGQGDVSYFGDPEVTYDDSGFGDLKSLGDK